LFEQHPSHSSDEVSHSSNNLWFKRERCQDNFFSFTTLYTKGVRDRSSVKVGW